MGACCSASAEDRQKALRSREIERENEQNQINEARVKKLLLLGAGESGSYIGSSHFEIWHQYFGL